MQSRLFPFALALVFITKKFYKKCSSRKKFTFFIDFYIFLGSRDSHSLQILGTRSRMSDEKFSESTSLRH